MLLPCRKAILAGRQARGRLGIRMDDGTEFISGPGDVLSIPSGHDGWVVGDEPVVVIDFHGASTYAKGGRTTQSRP